MKLTKKLEAEVLKAYNGYWDSYLRGDMKTMASFLDNDFKVIGSTDAEVFYNKKAAMKFYSATADQIAGTAQIRNRDIKIDPIDGLILITEKMDFYVLIDGKWTFYAKGRLSSFLRKKEDGWKFIQQHGSMPDTRAQEGEQVSIKKISKENLELRDAVKRRTIELEQKNRELEIETALERVRARTMAMQKSDELSETAVLLFHQLMSLGLDLRGCGFNIWEKNEKTCTTWMSGPEGTLSPPFNLPLTEDPFFIRYYESRQNGEDFWVYETGKEELAARYQYLRTLPDLGKLLAKEQEDGMVTELPTFVVDHVVNFSNGNLIFITNKHHPEAWDIFKRFGKVFEQTYTRFLDLQKAEAQAREANIEASLERVRAKAMAMHHSDELDEVLTVLFDQFDILGIIPMSTHMTLIDLESNTFTFRETGKAGHRSFGEQTVAIDSMDIWKDAAEKWRTSEPLSVNRLHFPKESLPVVWQVFHESFASMPDDAKIIPEDYPDGIYHTAGNCKFGYIGMNQTRKATEEEEQIVLKFATEFGRLYQRFLDLKKAEAQAREATIEASLERVRSKTMAMHNSQDVGITVAAMFDELVKLGVDKTIRCGIGILDDTTHMELWTASSSPDGEVVLNIGKVDMTMHPLLSGVTNAWKNKEQGFSYELAGKDLIDYYTVINNSPDYHFHADIKSLPAKIIHNDFFFPDGSLFAFTHEPITAETSLIFKRFAAVFGQTYRRFLDLQKAEAQAREAQIELGLERVRARAMAMQNSDELKELIGTVFIELTKLDLVLTRCLIMIFDPQSNASTWWMANSEAPSDPICLYVKNHQLPPYAAYIKAWKEQKNKWQYILEGKDKEGWDDFLFTETELSQLPDFVIAGMKAPDRVCLSGSFNNFGCLNLATLEPLSTEHFDILLRFAKVFDLTYTRFNDLQKAEAQAKEAQIETGLERVRSRSLAMHNTSELQEVIHTVHKELLNLNIAINGGSFIAINSDIDRTLRCWGSGGTADTSAEVHLPLYEKPFCTNLINKIKTGPGFFTEEYTQEEKKEFFTFLFKYEPWSMLDAKQKKETLSSTGGYTRSCCVSLHTSIFIINHFGEKFSVADNEILKRFGKVFEQAYIRFLDLQKAEAQAREATIEAALEKVRGKAMAMNDSKDLSSTIVLAFAELKKLGIRPLRFGVGLINKELHKAQLYSATSSADGDGVALIGWIVFKGHPVIENIYDYWIRNEDYFPVLEGEQLRSYYELLSSGLSVPNMSASQSGEKQYGHFFPLPVSCLYAWADHPFNETDIKILKRFSSIVELTFRRYIELQKSETSAREAIKQSALDRIRADIASMRTISDLERITPLIWNELTILGIPFIRCGVFIMDDSQQLIHTFLSTPDGKAIAAFHLPYTTPGNIARVVSHWQDKKKYIDHWDEAVFTEFAHTLVKQGALASPDQYLKTLPPGGFYLHFLPFLQGMLYVGNSTQLGEEEIKSLQSVADAFSTAYARYEDFNKLETAKQQVEKTLVDLKQTQAQLVQSEKMASLGELTAGIAHEIQNPLNFVNNFSEVSNELLDEMIAELDNDNKEDAIAIAGDVKQNLGKILHHGRRADGIVKGMLQHSRSSSATKEPTDINKLADEYLRLAYHGLRAKDKSFNATLKTDYDETIGSINIIPQDIGRAILNLITNAFYVVGEKKKHASVNAAGEGYEPTVSVSTKKLGDKVQVSVKDNGNGIPQKVLDKIFQPFFTTKPTGQGTGLGLSLSYDIVKAHGGEVKVETREGEGAEFIVQLPVI